MQQYLGFTAGRWLWSSEHKADSLIAKFKEAGAVLAGEIGCMSRVTAIISALVICIIVCPSSGLLIITVITPLPTKPSATKYRELKLANAAITDMQMLTHVAALDAKYTKELADAKAGNDALRDDVAAGRRRLHIKAVCQSVREATTASGVDNAASPRLGTPNGIISPLRERLITMQNN